MSILRCGGEKFHLYLARSVGHRTYTSVPRARGTKSARLSSSEPPDARARAKARRHIDDRPPLHAPFVLPALLDAAGDHLQLGECAPVYKAWAKCVEANAGQAKACAESLREFQKCHAQLFRGKR